MASCEWCASGVRVVCETPDEARRQEAVVGVDLGVNTLIAATDGATVILISGRAAKATVQYRNKQLARFQQALARKEQGSRRHKRLQRRTHQMLEKRKRRIRDLCHKATRQVAKAFPNATCYVGEPFTEAAQRIQAHPGAICQPGLYAQAHHSTRRQDGWRDCHQRSLFLADMSCMWGAEQAAQDLPLPTVQNQWPTRCGRGGQYPEPWRSRRYAPKSCPATAGQVSAPLAPPAA